MKSSRIEIVLESDGSNYQEWKYDIEIYADLTVKLGARPFVSTREALGEESY
jgi:hypothetical protein